VQKRLRMNLQLPRLRQVLGLGLLIALFELFDSTTGQILGRAIDRRTAGRSGGFATANNRVTNRADARREFRVWANKLIEFLGQHYMAAD
jgi:hypothetical protein